MQVKVLRKRSIPNIVHDDPEWETLANMVLTYNELPRQGDYMHLQNPVNSYGVMVHHLVWKYKGSSLSSVEIIVQ